MVDERSPALERGGSLYGVRKLNLKKVYEGERTDSEPAPQVLDALASWLARLTPRSAPARSTQPAADGPADIEDINAVQNLSVFRRSLMLLGIQKAQDEEAAEKAAAEEKTAASTSAEEQPGPLERAWRSTAELFTPRAETAPEAEAVPAPAAAPGLLGTVQWRLARTLEVLTPRGGRTPASPAPGPI